MEPLQIENPEVIIFRTFFNIPKSLQMLDLILVENGYLNENQYHLEKLYYLIHKLNQSHLEDKSLNEGDFVQLHSDILESLLGKNYYKRLLTTLTELGIVQENKSYQPGVKSKGYKLTEQYRNQPSDYIEFNGATGSFIEKLLKYYKDKMNKFLYKKEYKSAYLNLTSVRLHEEKTIKALKKKCVELGINDDFIPPVLCASTLEHVKNALLAKRNEIPGAVKICYWLSSVISILRKEWRFTVDRKANRVHTNITNLPKELRKCLILGETNDLVELDIPCSQLLFLGVKIKKQMGIEYKVRKDLIRFLIQTVKEDIYVTIGKRMRLIYDGMSQDEFKTARDEIKGKVFEGILFGKTYPNEISDYFKKNYPTVYNYIQKLKHDNYRNCSVQLQREESTYVYGNLVKEIVKLNPDLFFLTVHDSIIIIRSDLNMVYDTMITLFFKKYGENIKPKTTYYMEEFKHLDGQELEIDSFEEALLMIKRKNRKKEIEAQKKKEAEELNDLFDGFMEVVYINNNTLWDIKDLEELDKFFCNK